MTEAQHRGPHPIRVAMIEDDPAFCRDIEITLSQADDLRLSARASSLQEAYAMLDGEAADVVLLDLGLPDGDGGTLIGPIRQAWPACEVIVSTIFEDENRVLQAIRAGATGYLLKQTSLCEIATQIREVHAGGSSISPRIARRLLGYFKSPMPGSGGYPTAGAIPAPDAASVLTTAPLAPASEPHESGLSSREREVLEHVTRGFTAQEIGQQIGLSHWTIQTYVRRIYEKLGVRNRAEAVTRAHQLGLAATAAAASSRPA